MPAPFGELRCFRLYNFADLDKASNCLHNRAHLAVVIRLVQSVLSWHHANADVYLPACQRQRHPHSARLSTGRINFMSIMQKVQG